MAKIRLGWSPNVGAWKGVRPVVAPLADDEFDWAGVVVGHWRADRRVGTGRARAWKCVSRCGATGLFPASALETGATKTCDVCRAGGSGPPPGDGLLAAHAKVWEGVAVEYRSNLKGDGVKEWEAHGERVFLAFIDRTGLGREFGWKVAIRDCHYGKGRRDEIRVKSWRDGNRSVELHVSYSTGQYYYEIDLSCGRVDKPWAEIKAAIERAVLGVSQPPAATEPAKPAAKSTAKPSANGTHPAAPAAPAATALVGGVNLDTILKLRSGLDTLLAVGKDVASAAELRAELEATLAQRREEAAPLAEAAEAACEAQRKAAADLEECQNRVTRLNKELQAAMEERERLQAEATAAVLARDQALAAAAPAGEALDAAEAGVAEAIRLEEERAKTLAQAGDMAVILAALQKLGAAQ